MRTVDIPFKDWTRALDDFSARHDGDLVSLEVLAPTIGAQPQIRDLPLRGITAELTAPDVAITIAAARDDGEHITHVIHAPTHVRIEQTNEGTDVALQIESDDATAAILRLAS